jgi:hypothetical protein
VSREPLADALLILCSRITGGSCSNDVNLRKKTTGAASFLRLNTDGKPYRGKHPKGADS